MKMVEKKTYKVVLAVSLAVFLLLCGALVAHSLSAADDGAEKPADSPQNVSDTPAQEDIILEAGKADANKTASVRTFNVSGGESSVVYLGASDPCSEDPDTGYKFQLEIRSAGAAVRKVTFSAVGNKGFNDRHFRNPKPLVLIKPVVIPDQDQVMTMANTYFKLIEPNTALSLNRMSWKNLGVIKEDDKTQSVSMEALITDPDGAAVLRLVKTYTVTKQSFLADCNFTVENLSAAKQDVWFDLNGPVGIGREDSRTDDRNIVAGFLDNNEKIVAATRDLIIGLPMNLFTRKADVKTTWSQYQNAVREGNKEKIQESIEKLQLGFNLPGDEQGANFSWAAISNKYFTSVVRLQPDNGDKYCEWLNKASYVFYNPDNDNKGGNTGDESIGIKLRTKQVTLTAGEKKVYKFQLYFGPKDKQLFTRNQQFKNWGFINIITFSSCCCCPALIIRPIAFGILTLMEWIYYFIPNYGIAIIILVFIVRLLLHPLTKKGQVSMSKMSKLAPKIEQIKQKYGDDKAELNKQMMALYKEHGTSPFLGMVPMMIQMPIWIALYSAIYASISLRGAPFLPVWITDLSSPDALFRFPLITVPLLGRFDSFNLLPILMGVAFYLQQKLSPQQTAAANPQQATQQKMLMIMMPILFPLMLYSAPSGLNLYIMASSLAGAIEQYVIKKHIQKRDMLESEGLVSVTSKTGGKVKKKKPKPFFKRYV